MSSAKRAADAMNAPLRRELQRIQALLRSAPDTVEARHDVGLVVLAVKREPERYGKQAVALLASALGRDEATLYRFAQVASRWTEREIAEWIARASAAGHPLSWWHFVEASAIARKRDRDELLRRAVEERLSVRALTRLAAQSTKSTRAPAQVARELEVLARRAAAARERCACFAAASGPDLGAAAFGAALSRARAAAATLAQEAERTRADIEAAASTIHLDDASQSSTRASSS